jgi:hypothetical protein
MSLSNSLLAWQLEAGLISPEEAQSRLHEQSRSADDDAPIAASFAKEFAWTEFERAYPEYAGLHGGGLSDLGPGAALSRKQLKRQVGRARAVRERPLRHEHKSRRPQARDRSGPAPRRGRGPLMPYRDEHGRLMYRSWEARERNEWFPGDQRAKSRDPSWWDQRVPLPVQSAPTPAPRAPQSLGAIAERWARRQNGFDRVYERPTGASAGEQIGAWQRTLFGHRWP